MSSLTIGSFAVDRFRGTIQLPTVRVASYTSAHLAYAGAQLLPLYGRPFTVRTWRYDDAANRRFVANAFSSLKGEIVSLTEDGLNYGVSGINVPVPVRFLVHDVVHETIDTLVHVITNRDGVDNEYSPAGRIVTDWTFQAGPA